MQAIRHSASKSKIVLAWLLALGTLFLAAALGWWWWIHGRETGESEAPPDLVFSILKFIFGGLLLIAGAAVYLVVIFTTCFTFNFSRPAWSDLKGKLFLANIYVPVPISIGLGLMLAGFVSPMLVGAGLSAKVATLGPLFAMIIAVQIVQLWVAIWAPLEIRFIRKRLLAQGITPAQLENSFYIGISNPAAGLLKKFGTIEEDVGALWISPDYLSYYGDAEQFAITRDQLTLMERKADMNNTTMLAGVTHIILHLRQPDGTERQIRFHVEGVRTMGQKRRAMDHLAEQISDWHSRSAPAPPPPVPSA